MKGKWLSVEQFLKECAEFTDIDIEINDNDSYDMKPYLAQLRDPKSVRDVILEYANPVIELNVFKYGPYSIHANEWDATLKIDGFSTFPGLVERYTAVMNYALNNLELSKPEREQIDKGLEKIACWRKSTFRALG